MKDLTAQTRERCWKRVGVWGKEGPRCPELAHVIHCRNCEVFTQAGRNLLERPLPETYRDAWTNILAERKEEEILGWVSFVIFRVHKEWMALPTELFAEIIELQSIHRIPHRREGVLLGIVNVHGEIQLCASLESLLGIERASTPETGDRGEVFRRMMVIHYNGEGWVFPVAEICGVYHVVPRCFENVPVTIAKSKSSFTKAIFRWEGKDVALLDHELMLYTLRRSVQ